MAKGIGLLIGLHPAEHDGEEHEPGDVPPELHDIAEDLIAAVHGRDAAGAAEALYAAWCVLEAAEDGEGEAE